ncbi:PEP-utilizing enzyme [Rhodothermus marinus]|uniref:PEP-utilizing enzyme n=1 Tax=Rhodothermus marinus TaxID=29549 RepID=UPI001FB3A383|nr:PEP-utilizing enzyme [Rhodothermus marinus]
MARALGVPAVVSLHGLSDSVQTGDLIILDGIQGRVVVNPRPETLALYRTRQERYRRLLQDQQHLIPLPAETLDGHRFVLRANLELIDELDLLKKIRRRGHRPVPYRGALSDAGAAERL